MHIALVHLFPNIQ